MNDIVLILTEIKGSIYKESLLALLECSVRSMRVGDTAKESSFLHCFNTMLKTSPQIDQNFAFFLNKKLMFVLEQTSVRDNCEFGLLDALLGTASAYTQNLQKAMHGNNKDLPRIIDTSLLNAFIDLLDIITQKPMNKKMEFECNKVLFFLTTLLDALFDHGQMCLPSLVHEAAPKSLLCFSNILCSKNLRAPKYQAGIIQNFVSMAWKVSGQTTLEKSLATVVQWISIGSKGNARAEHVLHRINWDSYFELYFPPQPTKQGTLQVKRPIELKIRKNLRDVVSFVSKCHN